MSATLPRSHHFENTQRVVVKLGTRVVTDASGQLDYLLIERVAREISQLRQDGYQITVVSSGAVGAGLPLLGMNDRPKALAALQATAAVGQIHLMAAYSQAFGHYGTTIAQVLLTADDFADRRRYGYTRSTLEHLHRIGVVPVINENDTVAVEELRFSDNDRLAGLVCDAVEAQCLILFSDTDGLYTANPKVNPSARRLEVVSKVDHAIEALAVDVADGRSRGGMASKLSTARHATAHGAAAIIAAGKSQSLRAILRGEDIGTLFLPQPWTPRQRQRWLHKGAALGGSLVVDDGAVSAIRSGTSSLLPAGVCRVDGTFERLAVVQVASTDGKEIARGMVNYNSDDVHRILGHHSQAITSLLGYSFGDEVIHRDNLILENHHDT